jgi:hypothetical protein
MIISKISVNTVVCAFYEVGKFLAEILKINYFAIQFLRIFLLWKK